MQGRDFQFKLQQVWILVDLPNGKKAIRTKWVFRNKKDERGIVIRNKARLVAQGHRQAEDDFCWSITLDRKSKLEVSEYVAVLCKSAVDNTLDSKPIAGTMGKPQHDDKGFVGDEAVHKELGDRMEKAATTASSIEAEQDSGSGPRCQDTILGDVNAQTRFEITSIQSIDPPLSRGYTLGSGEDSTIDDILYITVI
ncbi:putative ribonuclease H-like domain-containing protein [Tanacetum coccineum]